MIEKARKGADIFFEKTTVDTHIIYSTKYVAKIVYSNHKMQKRY